MPSRAWRRASSSVRLLGVRRLEGRALTAGPATLNPAVVGGEQAAYLVRGPLGAGRCLVGVHRSGDELRGRYPLRQAGPGGTGGGRRRRGLRGLPAFVRGTAPGLR